MSMSSIRNSTIRWARVAAVAPPSSTQAKECCDRSNAFSIWRAYAGKRLIDSIDKKMLSDYVPWRKAYYHGRTDLHPNVRLNPADKTLQWEMMFIKMVLRYAKDRGYLGESNPSYTFKLATKRIRPDFTIGDFGQLKDALVTWRDAANSEPRRAARQLLHDYVMVLALSGIRVGEAKRLENQGRTANQRRPWPREHPVQCEG